MYGVSTRGFAAVLNLEWDFSEMAKRESREPVSEKWRLEAMRSEG